VSQSPEQLWPQLRSFWPTAGFTLISDKPELGVMETDWAENRAKLPQDFVRRTIGRIADGLFDSGQRDRFHLRVERSTSSNSTEIYLSHRAATEVAVTSTGGRSDTTRWQLSPSDPQVEAEMLGRLMLFLAPPSQVATTQGADQAALAAAANAVTKAPDAPARARLLDGRPAATLQVDDDFSRAWRRVGLALDRNGFTVEDRDRGQGLYYVRYVDPKLAGKEEPGFLARLFSGAKKEDYSGTRYRVGVQAEGKASVVAVFDSQGAPQNSESARNIVQLLLAELR
jgi:outer membrane protein assembly factor BamC